LYTKEQFAKLIDYTLLKPTATSADMTRFCADAKRHHFAAVVVMPYWVPLAVRELEGCDVKVCTPIGFPYGTTTRSSKVHEVRNAISNGADELDVVLNVGALKSGDIEFVRRELGDIVSATNLSCMTQEANRTLIKVIIETPYLNRDEMKLACEIVRDAGADFVNTSTGTAQNGAAVEDVHFIRGILGPAIGVKAAGGIRTLDHALNLLDAGANRLGTSTGVALVQAYDPDELLKSVR
jgi:deoxyribose-phosphate aldolase